MILGNELTDRHVRAIRFMDGTVETTNETVRIIGRNKATIDLVEAHVNKPKPLSEQYPDSEKDSLSRNSIRDAQTVLR